MHQFTITLLRHGETTAPNNLNGKTDVSLSELGEQQMHDALANIENLSQVISSPLIRCAKVAQEYALQCDLPFTINPEFAEIDFGDWDGQPFGELYRQQPELMDKFWRTPWEVTIPNGEQLDAFQHRIDNAWQQLINQQHNSLVVCHGGVIRYLIAKVLNLGPTNNSHITALKIDYAAVVEIQITVDEDKNVYPMLLWP
ncbi:histidine phosphatase family protein [Psychrobium sp. MM17-31]|uniref:histidine phosphatase family protein n=1 Tax=Psychrobium sp. MM17-31 TaxID=2917758 RepID=UPI001EF42CA0|nr:histidine phosphatase family protein [Psychrobium sp. MM17-31]MCG7530539.1 histidine phosphatase family protein [Psychrobium sp. MM17-31]